MNKEIVFMIDDREVQARQGQTILQAADDAGMYIPRLCAQKDLVPFGGCRVCTVLVNGRPCAACTQPAAAGIMVENDTATLRAIRKNIIEMLFVEGNHFCMFCEKSGNCELQALAYRMGICAPVLPYSFPERGVDATHPDLVIDRNRCVLCGRCVRASRDVDGKNVFEFVGRGARRQVAVNSVSCLADTDIAVTDKAVDSCPVGAILRKRVGYAVPIGKRLFDTEPIGSDIEKQKIASKCCQE